MNSNPSETTTLADAQLIEMRADEANQVEGGTNCQSPSCKKLGQAFLR